MMSLFPSSVPFVISLDLRKRSPPLKQHVLKSTAIEPSDIISHSSIELPRHSIRMLRQRVSLLANLANPRARISTSQLYQTARALNTKPESSSGAAANETHTTEKDNELDVQTSAAKGGRRDRQADDSSSSAAASERSHGQAPEDVKKEFPEKPPGPVIGMNDERGGVSQERCTSGRV